MMRLASRLLRSVVPAAGLLAVTIAPAACTAPAHAAAPVSRQGMPGAPSVPVLNWRSCDGGFQCATARVPLDYRHPHGAMISIAVIRHLATDRAHRAGTLFVNTGGPDEQIELFAGLFSAIPAAIRARFDVITFDCFAAAEHDALTRDEFGQLAVEPARRRSRFGLPDPVVAARALVDLGPGDGQCSRRHPPGQ
jgi:hypothetical protein